MKNYLRSHVWDRKVDDMSYNKQYSKQWYQKNKERIIQKWKDRRANNLEEFKQREKKYRDEHKEEAKEYQKQYYQEHKEDLNERSHQYYLDNKEDYLNKKAEQYQLNKKINRKANIEVYQNFIQHYKKKTLPNCENYEVLQNGEIWNKKDFKFVTKSIGDDGYYSVCLNYKRYRLSRLIASIFDDRDEAELKDMQCHHCNLNQLDNSISNLVFLPQELHDIMHKKLTNEQILLIGQQVKHLRGSAKTNKFVELVELFYKQV